MNVGTLVFWIAALGAAVVAVLSVAGGIRDLLTGLRRDLVETQKARLGIEKDRLELEQKLPLELQKLQEEVKRLQSRLVSPSVDVPGFDLADPNAYRELPRGKRR